MKKTILLLFILTLILSACSPKDNDTIKIGVIQWTEHPALDDALIGFKENLNENIELVIKNANDDSSNANMMVDQLLGEDVDLIYAIATPAAQVAVAKTKDTKTPVIFNAVSDAVSAGLVESNTSPGAHVTGVSDLAPVDAQLALIKEFLPDAKDIGVLYNTGEDNSLHQIEFIKSNIEKHSLKLHTQGISSAQEIEFATQTLIQKVDALYIITDNLIAKATSQVVGIANESKKPVFMAEAGQFEHGILASDSISYVKLGHLAAEMAEDVLLNHKDIGSIDVITGGSTDLLVNESVAKFLGLEIPDSILERAVLK